jgi:hypothetical protein
VCTIGHHEGRVKDTGRRILLGVIGALSTLATLDTVQAAPVLAANVSEVTNAQSFEELLQPIPNALAFLQASDEAHAAAKTGADAGNVKVAQYHHHHQRYRARPRAHHHHHQGQRG